MRFIFAFDLDQVSRGRSRAPVLSIGLFLEDLVCNYFFVPLLSVPTLVLVRNTTLLNSEAAVTSLMVDSLLAKV